MSDKKPIIKCAIYTRKSSEEGLEQDFNSLQAQREACEAYIKSQKHEGWEFIDKHYDDGGYSGGTLERPALKELLADIATGHINIIVVYKIDRLTRSLHDFSKIVEVLDKNETSFVSITQHFNTTTSMGRLTLNMLLSFAQFEREVTGERIRDKYAASKQKGMWMGGTAPLGYYRKDKKLFPDEIESKKLNLIFEKYIELKNVTKLKHWLEENRVKSQYDQPLSTGNLYKILVNRVYVGEVPHKDKWYKGLQEGILSPELFNKAQEILQENRIKDRSITNHKEASLLAGKIFDDKDNYMSPTHSNKKGKRYRYYLSQAVIRQEKQKIGNITKIAAGEIEQFITETIREIFKNTEVLHAILKDLPITTQKEILKKSKEINPPPQTIRDIISKVKIFKEKVEITYYPDYIKEILTSHYEGRKLRPEIKTQAEETIIKEIRIAVVDNGSKIIIGAGDEKQEQNEQLIHAVLKAYKWSKQLKERQVKNIEEISKKENVTSRHIRQILPISCLSPKIQESILKGTQPRDLTIAKLKAITTTDWQKQEKILGF
jgi:DNA invertase Pin-like site-specific DNA recombinase